MRLLLLLSVLGFPVMEMFVLAKIGQHIGWWLAVWLIMSALTGLALIKEARFNLVRELGVALSSGGSNIPALLSSGRILIAGFLFIFPGVMSDFIALALILLPHQRTATVSTGGSERVFDAEFRRER
ncbi:MAG: FxsA family protein [Burkholderiales bacterium]